MIRYNFLFPNRWNIQNLQNIVLNTFCFKWLQKVKKRTPGSHFPTHGVRNLAIYVLSGGYRVNSEMLRDKR